jgi:hypothetical protein
VYHPFLANQAAAERIAQSVFGRIQAVGHPVAYDFKTFLAFMVKPMQRIQKYPLFFKVG